MTGARIVARGLLALVMGVACAHAHATDQDENYTTQRLLIFNERDEVLLQLNAMGWSTPGQRFDRPLSLRAALDELAARYGVRIDDVRLAGLLTYEYGDSPAISSRTHYRARLAGGEPRAPEGVRALRWFPREAAIAAMALDSQRAPPSFVEMTTRMLREPDTVWGGAFHVWQEDGVHRSRALEAMYPLTGPEEKP